MKYSLIQLLILGSSNFICAQTIDPIWTHFEAANGSTLYGTPFVMVDSFHNTIICGSDYHPGPGLSFLTTKYDPNGIRLWQRKFDLLGSDDIISAATDKEGSVYVGGNTSLNSLNGTLPRFIVIKYAANGDSLWNYRFDGPTVGVNYVTKVLLDSEQNLVVFGQYGDTVALRGGLFVAKVSPDGQELWRATYLDSIYSLGGFDVRWTDDRWVFWGRNSSTADGNRFLAWQINNDGNTLGLSFTEPDFDNLPDNQHIDNEGNLYVGQWRKYKIVKYNLLGIKEWEYHKVNTTNSPFVLPARINDIETNNIGEVFVTGVFLVDSIGHLPLTTKLSNTGQFIWEHSIILNGIEVGAPSKISWIEPDVFLVTGSISIDLDSNFYEFYLAVYSDMGYKNGGITDLEGQRNVPTSLCRDQEFMYIAGHAGRKTIAESNNQILCKYALSELVSTHTAPQPIGQLSIWPNPSTDWVRIQIPETTTTKEIRTMELTDVAGKTLRSQQLTSQDPYFDWSLEGLPAGTYFVILKQNGLPTHTEQVIKP